MKKINIALRRNEITGRNSSTETGRVYGDQPAISFHSREDMVSRYLRGPEASAGSRAPIADSFIEVDLDHRQLKLMDRSLESGGSREVTGIFNRESKGVLRLNLEFAEKKVSKYLSAKTLAEMLEMSPRTIYRMHKQKSLPGVRIGRNLRFKFEDVLDFLNSHLEKCEG